MDNKQTKAKLNRVLYVSAMLVLCAVAIVIAITSSVNRARRESYESTLPDGTTAAPSTTDTPTTRPAPESTKDKPTGLDTPETTAPPETTGTGIIGPGDGNYEDDKPTSALPTFYVPVKGTVSQNHDDTTAVYSVTMGDYRVHLGVDIACNISDEVGAAAAGTVSQVWDDPLMGKCVSISHAGGALSVYKNLAPDLAAGIEVGKTVSAGQTIGLVGESAIIEIAEEPHLHFEMTVNGTHVDPLDYFDPASVTTSLSTNLYE